MEVLLNLLILCNQGNIHALSNKFLAQSIIWHLRSKPTGLDPVNARLLSDLVLLSAHVAAL